MAHFVCLKCILMNLCNQKILNTCFQTKHVYLADMFSFSVYLSSNIFMVLHFVYHILVKFFAELEENGILSVA